MKFRFSVSLLLVSSLLLSQPQWQHKKIKALRIQRKMIHKIKKIRASHWLWKSSKDEPTSAEGPINTRRFKIT